METRVAPSPAPGCTPAMVDQSATHLRAHGVEVVGPVDHAVIYSSYFHNLPATVQG